MDWSSIYEENGEEEGDWTGWIGGRLAPVVESFSNSGQYTPMICFAFTVNYILGVGCLGIPYAFHKSGILLGSIIICLLSSVSFVTVQWVAEAGHRDIQLRRRGLGMSPAYFGTRKRSVTSSNYQSIRSGDPPSKSHRKSSSEDNDTGYSSMSALLHRQNSDDLAEVARCRVRSLSTDGTGLLLESDEAEVTDLVCQFVGPVGKIVFQCSLMLLTFVGLIAYTQVFVKTFSMQILPGLSPVVPSLLFGVIVVPLSCVDLSEQIYIQVAMFLLRFLSLAILLFGTIVAMFTDSQDAFFTSNPPTRTPYLSTDIPLFAISGFGIMFTTGIFSQLFQHSVPGLIRPLSSNDKKYALTIFGAALATTGLLYIAIGCVCVAYFGGYINESINLNFVDFSWGVQKMSWLQNVVIRTISMMVVLFPALDTISVFPLIANTLGNSLHVFFPLYKLIIDWRRNSDVKDARLQAQRFWRLVASIPPVLISLWVENLSLTLQVAGICGIIVALVTPALLQYFSVRQHNDVPDDDTPLHDVNPYASHFSKRVYVYGVLGLAFVALGICLKQILQQ